MSTVRATTRYVVGGTGDETLSLPVVDAKAVNTVRLAPAEIPVPVGYSTGTGRTSEK